MPGKCTGATAAAIIKAHLMIAYIALNVCIRHAGELPSAWAWLGLQGRAAHATYTRVSALLYVPAFASLCKRQPPITHVTLLQRLPTAVQVPILD
jgi:hypothetical protein